MSNEQGKIKIIRPQPGGQERFCRSNVDVCFFGGVLGGGKTFGAILSIAEATLDPNFRGIFLRKTLGDLKTAGGVVDGFKEAYGPIVNVKVSENPRITYPSGAYVEARQVQDETPSKIIETWKGVQTDFYAFEELTSYNWFTFKYLMSRCRGKGKWTGKIRATLNPKKDHWVRTWLDWYIGEDGYIIPERDGCVRYFYLNGEKVTDIVWGNSKEEVYEKCKVDIERKLSKLGGDFTYKDMIKSFVFYKGNLAENKALIGNNSGYVGSVAATGGKVAQQLIEGNWNVDIQDETDAPIKPESARNVFYNQECRNGDKWITADLADVGKDNSVFLAWDGFHCFDILILTKATPRMNAEYLQMFAAKHGIPDTHIIFDGTRALYIHDYIPDAVAFISSKSPTGLFARGVRCLKDECYLRLVYVLENRGMSFAASVGDRRYEHQELRQELSVQTEFEEECSVVRFEQLPNGRKCLMGKRAMNSHLGKSRSMDVLDPVAMRMYPILRYQPGEELEMTAIDGTFEDEGSGRTFGFNIYSETNWC